MKKQLIPLDEFVTSQSLVSRRDLLALINQNKVKINTTIVSDLNQLLDPTLDKVFIDGSQIKNQHKYFYLKYNKPKGILSTMEDPKGRACIGDVIKLLRLPLFPVGRLDRETTGLLILTNDGAFSQKISHPSFECSKRYSVGLDKRLTTKDQTRLLTGVILDDGPLRFKECQADDKQLIVSISEGRNRIVRRTFELLGYSVLKLKRISIGSLELNDLKSGETKAFTRSELKFFGIS